MRTARGSRRFQCGEWTTRSTLCRQETSFSFAKCHGLKGKFRSSCWYASSRNRNPAMIPPSESTPSLSVEIRSQSTFQIALRAGQGKRWRESDNIFVPDTLKPPRLANEWPELLQIVDVDNGLAWEFPAKSYLDILQRLEHLQLKAKPIPYWVLALAGRNFRPHAKGLLENLSARILRVVCADERPAECPDGEVLRRRLEEIVRGHGNVDEKYAGIPMNYTCRAEEAPSVTELEGMKKQKLVELAKERKLKVSGTKSVLISRILESFSVDEKNADPTDCITNEFPGVQLGPNKLLEYQLDGVRRGIQRYGRLLVGDEMGLGKTVQSLMIALWYEREWPVLVVAPATVRGVWEEHVRSWLAPLVNPTDIFSAVKGSDQIPPESKFVLCSFDLIARNKHLQQTSSGEAFKVMICDESHYIKSPSAKRTQVLVPLMEKANRVMLLTGTPLQNRASELYTQIKAIVPEILPDYSTYAQRYCVKKERTFGRGRYRRTQISWEGSTKPEELYTILLSSIMIRRRKRDVLSELPTKRRQRVVLDGLEPGRIAHIRDEIDNHRRQLLAAANGEQNAGAGILSKVFWLTAEAKLDAVCSYVRYLLETGQKFIIFAHHQVVIDEIEGTLCKERANCIRIDGRTPASIRNELAERFQKDSNVKVALLSITAAGTGLTLHAASLVVFAELFWVPGQLLQCEDRAHRHGQKNSVDVHYLIAPGTMDDIMFPMINRKLAHSSKTLDGGFGTSQLINSSDDVR